MIRAGVHIYILYYVSNLYIIYLPLRAPEMLSSLSKPRISIFNAQLTLFVRRMTLHNSIGKYHHFIN